MRGVGAAPHFSTSGAKATDFSRFCAHLHPVHFIADLTPNAKEQSTPL